MTHAFDVLGDPVRRRILELLAEGAQLGAIADVVRPEFGISQPAASQHLTPEGGVLEGVGLVTTALAS